MNQTASQKPTMDTLEVSGLPKAMGGAHGEHFRWRIREFIEMRLTAVSRYIDERKKLARSIARPLSVAELKEIGRESLSVFSAWDPLGFEEHSAIAAGAGVSSIELHTVAQMTDLRDALLLSSASGPRLQPGTPSTDPGEGCSAVVVPARRTRLEEALAAQTWDLNPDDVDFVVAIKRTPQAGLTTWSVSCTGCLTLMGMNERGVAVGTTNLKTYGSRAGVGYIAILHRALREDNAEKATDVVRNAPHAGAHSYWLVDPIAQFEWEISPTAATMRTADPAGFCRTNHCLSPALQAIEGEVPNESSLSRLQTMESWLSANDHTVASVKKLLCDRSNGVHSINRYAEDEQGTATNAVIIAEPAQRRLHVCRGPGDRGEWRTLQL